MKYVFLSFAIVLSLSLVSQETKKQHNYSTVLWLGYFNQVKLNSSLSLVADVQYRTRNGLTESNQVLARTGLQYQWNKFSFTIGAAHFRYFIADDKTRGEWRPWQELAIREEYEKLQLTHRFRVEERFNQMNKGPEVLNEYSFNLRFRYKIDLQFPLCIIKEKRVKGTLGNEVMLNAGNTIRYNYFDQNRLSAGLLIECTNKFAVQPQYIFISQQLPDGLTINQSSVIRLNVVQKF